MPVAARRHGGTCAAVVVDFRGKAYNGSDGNGRVPTEPGRRWQAGCQTGLRPSIVASDLSSELAPDGATLESRLPNAEPS